MDDYNKLNSGLVFNQMKYNTLLQMDCCCFFEYDIKSDRLSFSDNMVIPELSGKEIEHVTFQATSVVVDKDVQAFVDFLHFGKEYPIEFQIKGYVKNAIWCLAKGRKILDENEEVISFIGYILNIDERKHREIEESKAKRRDALTKTLNQTAMKEIISKTIRESDFEDTYTMIILDICEFEKVNKRYGECFGDVVLNNIAMTVTTQLNPDDLIGRVGGDEFLLFLKQRSNDEVLREIQKITNVVEKIYYGENNEKQLKCNMGIATFPMHGTSYNELFLKADLALFHAKQMGHGNFVFYEYGKLEIPEVPKGQIFYNHYNTSGLESLSTSDIDMELVNFALDLLAKTKDVGSAVNILLDKIGRTFCVNDVFVIEREKRYKRAVATYVWNVKSGIGMSDLGDDIPEQFMHALKNKQSNGDIAYIVSEKELAKHVSWDDAIEKEPKSVLVCGYYDGTQLKGCIYMGDCNNTRYWKKREIDSFLFVSKIIAFYLLKLRESERLSEKMQMVKNYDMLTGLPTLHKFKRDIQIIFSSHPETKFVIAFMDINNFKNVNDTLGYQKGDDLLKDWSAFLNKESIPMQMNARAGGDNFLSFIPFEEESKIKENIMTMIAKFLEEQKKKNISCNIGLAVGLYIVKPETTDFMGAIDNANVARKHVKNSSLCICEFYDDKMEHEILKERMIVNSMEGALENKEFKVYLQAKISLENSCISGAEALVRWIKPDGAIMPPNDFIPLFEKNGFVIQLDFYIYEEVCKLLRSWKREGKPIVPISVNVSRIHLYQDDFLEKVLAIIRKYEIEPWMLEFELTESIFLDTTINAIEIMKELRKLGFCVSIDDFGAGYSSLNLLKDMQSDVLKLDKEFFRQGDMKREEQIIVSSIISMAKQLNMKVLSEGVETKKQSDFLKAVNCDMAQGYLYAKPLPIPEFEELLKRCTEANYFRT